MGGGFGAVAVMEAARRRSPLAGRIIAPLQMGAEVAACKQLSPSMLTYAITIFTGAFLLFQVEPLLARYILPWFGGTPAVWITCMLFFQLLLVAGYAYSHLNSRLAYGPATGNCSHRDRLSHASC